MSALRGEGYTAFASAVCNLACVELRAIVAKIFQFFEPYTPAHHFEGGKNDPLFRTKLKIASELVEETLERSIPFRAVVADSFYGEDEAFKQSLSELGVGYVLALKPSHAWWHKIGEIGSPYEAALAASEAWEDARHPGDWVKVVRRFTDGHEETWWALEVDVGPYYGPETRPWLEPIPDKERHSHKTPLAVGVLRVQLLLVGIWVLADRGDDGAGERSRRRIGRKGEKETPSVMAGGAPSGKGVAGALRNAMAILESVLWDVPTAGAKSTA